MVYRTFGDLKNQVEAELDIQGEEFVSPQELMQYFNSGVTFCEAQIIKLGLREKYLQADTTLDTVAGQSDYTLPSDIIANKIRKIVYRNQTLIYTVKPLIREDAYEAEDISAQNPSSENYAYSLYKVGTQNILRLTPRAALSVTGALRVIYFKLLNRYTQDSDICDLPDICYEYIMCYVRFRVNQKESNTNAGDEKQNLLALTTLMQETLSGQVADPDMELIEADYSHYGDMN